MAWAAGPSGPPPAPPAGYLHGDEAGFVRRRARYILSMDMGLGMTILMVAMMVLMVGAILWGALAAGGSRLRSALSRKGGRHGRVDDRHAAGRPPASG